MFAVLAVALLAAPATTARPWRVEAISTGGPARSGAVDVLPDGRTAVLFRQTGRPTSRLELRVGRRTRLLDASPSTAGFAGIDLQHDARGRLVAVWTRAGQVFAWTAASGKLQVGVGATAALSVAASGHAALAYSAADGIFVARGSARSGFGKAERIATASNNPAVPGIGVSRTGRIVVSWIDVEGRVAVRSASGSRPFGTTYVVPLRAREPGASLFSLGSEVALTRNGRAVVVVYSVLGRDQEVVDTRVEAFDWSARAARPSAASTLSRGVAAGPPDVVATGASAVIAWTQRPRGAPRALWATRWTGKGPQRPNVYDTRALGSATLLAPASRDAVNVFYRAGGPRWFRVRLSAAGLYSGTSVVTPAGERVDAIDVAASGRHVAAAWTAGPRAHVEIARPR